MNTVEVIVKGPAGVGKSTVAMVIEEALSGYMCDVKVVDDNGVGVVDEKPGVMRKSFRNRLSTLIQNGLFVSINTKLAK